MLQVQNLSAQTAQHRCILQNLSFTVKPGNCLCIIGESGCGKTSTLLSLMGLFEGTLSGKILLDEEDLLAMSEKELCKIRGNTMGMVFQNPRLCLNPVRKIGRQLEDAIAVHQKLGAGKRKQRSIELLKSVALENPEKLYNDYPYMLSGGMGQRVGVAIAIACDPTVVLADEPTSALDPPLHKQIISLFATLKAQGVSLVIATHQKKLVESLADEIIVMQNGKIVEQGAAEELLHSPQHPYTKMFLSD